MLPPRVRRPLAKAIEAAARLGYFARGVVHISVGAIALAAALDLTPHAAGMQGALEAWSRWPAGLLLLTFTALGLVGFAVWRGVQALGDVEGEGLAPMALLNRGGQAISGFVYAALAFSLFEALDALSDFRDPDEQAQARATTAEALSWPFGELLVTAAGLFILMAGLGSMGRALFDDFARTLRCDPEARPWIGALARIGYFGRGLALLPLGLFVTLTGRRASAEGARSLGGALDALERQPLGDVVLAGVGIGLMAFGVFALLESWLRPIRAERALS